jgi:beta-glucosidase/6-phospho-beta-glucosidase/beta-galactosidase
MTNLVPLTNRQRQRVEKEIVDTTNALQKELSYSEDLQKADRIDFLTAHIEKLNGMMENGWNAPSFQ